MPNMEVKIADNEQSVLYLMIVNLPTEEELAEANQATQRVPGRSDSDLSASKSV